MLKYKRVDFDNSLIVYQYYPEGRDSYGIISYDAKIGRMSYDKIADGDEYKVYGNMMLSKLRSFIEDGIFRESGTVAFY